MSRSMQSLVMLTALAVGAVACAPAEGGDNADLDKELQALKERVAALEKELATVKQNLPPNQAMEQEAAQELQKIQLLMRQGKTEQAKTDLNTFMAKYGRTQTGGRARRLQQELSVVGKENPADWGITKWFQGESDIQLGGDKTTFVVFWETWCPHCKREVPKVQKIYTDLKDKGLQVIGVTKVNRSATDDKVAEFIKSNNLSYPIAKENGELSSYFAVAGIPAAAVVKDGKIVWRGHPANLTMQMLENWL
jgi:thiol-disulfide isomerase/thioredoxin